MDLSNSIQSNPLNGPNTSRPVNRQEGTTRKPAAGKLKAYQSQASAPVKIDLSSKSSKLMDKALELMKSEETFRPDAVEKAKLQVRFWQGLNDSEADRISDDLLLR